MHIKQPYLNAIKYLIIVIYITIPVLLFYTVFARYQLSLPLGCDEFGYLNMAKAISENRLFKNHASRPFDKELLSYLKKTYPDYRNYSNLITPYAYHFVPRVSKVINQYPPGTSLLLSIFPIHNRKPFFAPVCAFLLMVFLLLAFKINSGTISFLNLNLAIIVASLFYFVPPFKNYFDYVTSVPATYGVLLAAGYLLVRKPNWAFLLLGLSSILRIINVMFFIPFLLIYLGREIPVNEYFSRKTLKKTLTALILLFSGGLGVYFLYVWILLGNPFLPTYSFIDQEFALKAVTTNFNYYFNFNNPWFRLHILLLILVTFNTITLKTPVKWSIFSLLISIYNYLFFVFHKVRISYYPYATTLIIMGILLFQYEEVLKKTKFRKVIVIAGIIMLLLPVNTLVVCLRNSYRLHPRDDFQKKAKVYKDCFSKYDVIWADLRTGTVEYATSKASFRYIWGGEEVRNDVILWLKSHGYSQAIWAENIETPIAHIEKSLNKIGINYKIRSCPKLGKIIEIYE
jgi:hypothetical protein